MILASSNGFQLLEFCIKFGDKIFGDLCINRGVEFIGDLGNNGTDNLILTLNRGYIVPQPAPTLFACMSIFTLNPSIV
jgi:hypothetical protein